MIETDLIGQIVVSKCGRDSGRSFLVVGIAEEDFLYISDGRLRKIDKPKKKRMKHLMFTNRCSEKIRSQLLMCQHITNRQIREELSGDMVSDRITDSKTNGTVYLGD